MRAFVIVLMIALLPLRGWVGAAMAADMALPAATQSGIHAGYDDTTTQPGFLHHDCAMHDSGAQTGGNDGDGALADGCSACQVCHSVGMESSPMALALLTLPRALLPVVAFHFVSADRALNAEPPIA